MNGPGTALLGARCPALPAGADVLRDQVGQPGALGKGHDRGQARVRHEIWIVERCARLCQATQQSHLQGVLPNCGHGSWQLPFSQAKGTFT